MTPYKEQCAFVCICIHMYELCIIGSFWVLWTSKLYFIGSSWFDMLFYSYLYFLPSYIYWFPVFLGSYSLQMNMLFIIICLRTTSSSIGIIFFRGDAVEWSYKHAHCKFPFTSFGVRKTGSTLLRTRGRGPHYHERKFIWIIIIVNIATFFL